MGHWNSGRLKKLFGELLDMKIALCLHGLVGTIDKYGKGIVDIPPRVGHEHFKRHIVDVNNEVDTFIHTWSVDWEEGLKELYNPVAMTAEEQPDFKMKGNLKEMAKKAMKDATFEGPDLATFMNRTQAIYCRWKSTQKVLNLLKESGKQYDYVLLTRFDVAFLVDFVFKNYDSNKSYAMGPAGPTYDGIQHINDLWFFANQENMIKFSNLFDSLEEEKYKLHINSNHALARQHLIETGLNDKLEYVFKREWTGTPGKITSDTPLVRWFYESYLDESIFSDRFHKIHNTKDILENKRKEYEARIIRD